jgi:hypothetical protein
MMMKDDYDDEEELTLSQRDRCKTRHAYQI